MKFKIEFDCDSAAFDEDANNEILRILLVVATQVSRKQNGEEFSYIVRDINGNTIGDYSLK